MRLGYVLLVPAGAAAALSRGPPSGRSCTWPATASCGSSTPAADASGTAQLAARAGRPAAQGARPRPPRRHGPAVRRPRVLPPQRAARPRLGRGPQLALRARARRARGDGRRRDDGAPAPPARRRGRWAPSATACCSRARGSSSGIRGAAASCVTCTSTRPARARPGRDVVTACDAAYAVLRLIDSGTGARARPRAVRERVRAVERRRSPRTAASASPSASPSRRAALARARRRGAARVAIVPGSGSRRATRSSPGRRRPNVFLTGGTASPAACSSATGSGTPRAQPIDVYVGDFYDLAAI